MSISVNGSLHGYFRCTRGVRQGDPLSPLLFCLAEEVLSRQISKLVEDNKLSLMQGSRGVNFPSHCFYADDIMIFCTSRKSNLQNLKNLFVSYSNCSGQFVSQSKSTIFCGAMVRSRQLELAQFIGFPLGSLPFLYLGIPIFRGKPKRIHFQHLVDKIKNKLANWKAVLLSFAGRAQLIRSVIQVTVAWSKVCRPFSEGGLNIRSLTTLNEASNLKLCWDMLLSNDSWAKVLRAQVLRDFFNFPTAWRSSLNYSVASYIHNYHWNLPQQVIDLCPGNIWNCLAEVLNCRIQLSCTSEVWKLCDRNWSPQCKVVVQELCINTIHTIWNCRNMKRFQNNPTYWRNAITNIKADVQLAGTWTNLPFRNSIEDFRILKLFDVPIHPPRPSLIKKFFGSSGDFIIGFSKNLGKHNAFFAELSGALRAIELAQLHHWNHLWLESDSSLVVKAFSNQAAIPWLLRNRWINCHVYTRHINFLITHVYREANSCADLLANEGLTVTPPLNMLTIAWTQKSDDFTPRGTSNLLK
ncbi:uncharacterized protein LOC131649906 [Vicia villosa]|uniref:uncharacterized protein LOC131649906 n=1 Tax=Vicia villosa TaxID=3911 RepID=UPI00273CBE43|nr:uncharacterized protein LOC131649906 [Vicia villosa]